MTDNGSIHVDPGMMEEMASNFSALAAEFAEDTGRAQNLVNELCSEWTGRASEAFLAEFGELEPELRRAEELMERISRQLRNTAAAFQEGDDSISGRFNN